MKAYFILFTDIPGYTDLSRDSSEQLQDTLTRYKAILRQCIESAGGLLQHSRADKSLSLYESASQAIQAAIEKTRAAIELAEVAGLRSAVDELSGLSYQMTERLYSALGEGGAE